MTTSESRKIALLDLDAFFAAVEVTKDPALANYPFAVGGGGERGVVATCNYKARQYGVRSAMSGFHARRLCPDLVFVKPDMASYKAMSQRVLTLLQDITPIIQPASIDEFYLDLSASTLFQGSATRMMTFVRDELRSLGITGSAGISNQKMVAKIASNERKPDGQFVVPPEEVVHYISGLSLARIPGIGPKSQERLRHAGYTTGLHIQQADVTRLQQLLGDHSAYLLYQRCQGIDLRPVKTEQVRKQVSIEDTLPRDIHHLREAEIMLEKQLLPNLKKRLKTDSWQQTKIRTQTLKLKFSDFTQTTISRSANKVSPSLYYQLLKEAWPRTAGRGVRLMGLAVTLPDPDEDRQLELDLE
ncbi:MAG: DNA polymerase IV [Idiomarina sp.]|nr:DNA polymerase IV [Idiomarina sp.]